MFNLFDNKTVIKLDRLLNEFVFMHIQCVKICINSFVPVPDSLYIGWYESFWVINKMRALQSKQSKNINFMSTKIIFFLKNIF